ncbi:MAG: hypothetical protein ACXWRU_16570 [Pseudobdellovibrionaceae bacterium]
MLLLVTFIIPLSTFAGNGSGGVGPRPGMGMMALKPQIVFNMSESGDTVRFAHGQFVNKQWQIKNVEMPKEDLLHRQDVMNALRESLRDNRWAEIK